MPAPVCTLPDRTRPDLIGGPDITCVPPATDLPSALAAINALRGAFMQMTGQVQPQSRTQTPGTFGVSVKKSNDKSKQNAWKEINRTTKKERVENPDDSSQYVMIEVINTITMQNQSTGEQWVWRR